MLRSNRLCSICNLILKFGYLNHLLNSKILKIFNFKLNNEITLNSVSNKIVELTFFRNIRTSDIQKKVILALKYKHFFRYKLM